MEPQFIHEYKEIYGDSLSRARTLIVGGYWHLKKNKLDFKNKIEDFHHIQNTAEGVVESLEIFLDAAEGERGIGGVQPYINEILDTINIHLDRLKKYYPLNLPAKLKTKEDQRAEGKFQQLIFKGEQKIKAKLRTLNVENNMEGFHVEFFNDEVATLPMMSILCSLFPDIAAKVESLDIDWDLVMDNGMYINIPKAQVPDYNPKKHFWDQDLAVLQFYVSEWNKIKNGVIIDGYHLNGWLYDHLNYFKTPIGDKGDDIMNPPLRDNEWYWHEILKDAEKKARDMEDAGVFIFGTRRYGKALKNSAKLFYAKDERPIGDAKVGDKIFGSDGKLTTIEGVYPQGKRQLYKVTMEDGRSIECCDEHLWTVTNKNGTKSVIPLKDIRKRLTKTNPFYIPVTKPLAYEAEVFGIEPYLLGYMIGDGGLTQSLDISFTPEDRDELKELLSKGLSQHGCGLIETQASRWRVTEQANLKTEVHRQGLNKPSWEKRVPESYFRGSEEQRRSVLAGLLDSDGCAHINKSGSGKLKSNISFTTTSEGLKDDIIRICRSLGIRTSDHSRQRIRKGVLNRVSYEVLLHTSTKVFKLSRKNDKLIPRLSGEVSKCRIVSIEKTTVEEATCIRVSNESREFVTDDYIVTHNSSCEASMVYYKLKTNPAKNGTLTATNSEDIESITDKINIALEYCHPAFYVNTTSKDWSKKVSFGLKTKGGRNLKLFNLNIINTDSGSKRGGQKTAGGAPVVFVMDEAGKESFLKAYNAAIPSFETSTGWKCIPFFVGCVCAGTLVHTHKGDLVKIEDLKQEDGILGFDGKGITKEPITYMQKPFKKECVRITTLHGSSIECSIDHPFLSSKKGSISKTTTFTEAQYLKEGDILYKPDSMQDMQESRYKNLPFKQNEKYLTKIGYEEVRDVAQYTIKKIEFLGEKDVYNLTASKTNTYLANGFITHNTGGDEDLSSEAEKVLANPKAFRFIEMDWDLLERNIPKEAITWNRRTFGWFIPAQMGYKKGFKRIKRTFADFLGIESKELSNIDIYQTDWINNTAVCKADRERLKGDKTQLQQETVFYPLDPEECFMSAKKNPFPASGIKRHKEKLQKEGDPIYGLGRPIGLERNKQNSNKIDMFLDTTRQVATFPHDGSHVDCPFVLYDDFPETRPTDPNRFVAGCLTPGEQVLTDKGLMNVEDINFSNKLINKEGKLVDILALQVHEKVEEDIYTIKVGNSYRETTFTKEHPIFVSRPKFYEGGVSKGRTKQFNFGKEKFLKASEVSVGDWIKYPNIYKQPNPYNTERMMDLGELKYNSTVNSVLDNGDFWKFLGMYLKSGYIAKRGDKSLVHIYFGHQETEQIEDCIDTVLRVFGKECFKKVEGGEIKVEFENKQLYYFLKYSFGKTAQSKCLPEWAKYVGSYFKYQLIFGYLNAPIGSTPIMEFTNKSLILLEGIQDILFSLGVVSNLTLLHKSGAVMTPDGLTHKVKETYILKIDEADEVELRNPIKGKNNCFLSEDLNYIYFKVKSIKKSTYTGKVYNFECETNTFLTPHITTHNCDDYKQDESNGDSIGAFYIFDRLKRKIVLGLATRPDPHTDFHKQMHMALDAWNCKSFMENEDMDFKKYLDRVTQPVLYLHKGFDAYDDFSKFQNGTRKFGWRPDKNTTPLVKGYAVDYTRDDVDHEDNLGNISHTVAGYERIEDIQLLEEMVKNKAGGNFDRLVAFGSCLAIDYYLTSKFITPRTNTQKTKDKEEVDTYGKSRRRGFFSNTRRRLF